jgi:hypothetical protein
MFKLLKHVYSYFSDEDVGGFGYGKKTKPKFDRWCEYDCLNEDGDQFVYMSSAETALEPHWHESHKSFNPSNLTDEFWAQLTQYVESTKTVTRLKKAGFVPEWHVMYTQV